MAASMTLEKGAKAKAAGDMQDLNFAADAGAYRYVGVRFRLNGISGAPTLGTVTIQVQTATENKMEEYGAVPGSGGAALEWTINFDDPAGDIHFETSETFLRYLRQPVARASGNCGSGPTRQGLPTSRPPESRRARWWRSAGWCRLRPQVVSCRFCLRR